MNQRSSLNSFLLPSSLFLCAPVHVLCALPLRWFSVACLRVRRVLPRPPPPDCSGRAAFALCPDLFSLFHHTTLVSAKASNLNPALSHAALRRFSFPLSHLLTSREHPRNHVRRHSLDRPQGRRSLRALPQGQDKVRLRSRAQPTVQKLLKGYARLLSSIRERRPPQRPESCSSYQPVAPVARQSPGLRVRVL